MRRQLISMTITATALCLVSLGGCGSAAVNVSSTKSPEPAPTAAVAGKQAETPVAPAKTDTQPTSRPVVTREAQHASQSDRAQELLRQAREALGGEAKLKEVQNFTMSGAFRRASNGQEQAGEKRVDLLLPDKFKTSETLSLIAGIELTIVNALNGNQAWSDSRTSAGNAQVMAMRRGGNEQQSNADQARMLRSNLTRYMLVLFLMPPPNSSVEFVYGGEAEAADGRADILDLKDANATIGRMFIDQKTHRPLMLTYRDIVMRMKTLKSTAGAGGGENIDKIVKDARANPPARQESDVQMHLSDYKAEKGILLPHLITITVDDKPYEEWSLKSFKVNSSDLTPQKFEKEK